MNWKTIWELTKINILYSNPQTLTALKKKQKRNPKKKFSAYKSMIQQQLLLIVLFTVIYLSMFIGMDFSHYPGFFSFYVATFFIMATISAFTSMYTIFYESGDVKLYVHLPIKPSELYVAKIISSLGMGSVFLMPLLSLFFIAYWQIVGIVLAIPITLVLFLVLLMSSMVISLYLNSLIGRIIVRSQRRKLISTALMFVSTFGAIGLILYLNMTNQSRLMEEGNLLDRVAIPYFRGYHDIVQEPVGISSLVNFWLPLLFIIALIIGIVKYVMPHYYHEVLYVNTKTQSSKKKVVRDFKETSLNKILIRHHLSTLQNATLLTQTYLMPLVYAVIFITPSLANDSDLSKIITADYFGSALLVGIVLGSMCSMPSSFLGVGLSLEKDNFVSFKALPLNFKYFLKQKFVILFLLQACIPVLVYGCLGFFILKLSPVIVIAFLLGLVLMTSIQGQFMYRRDYKLLDLKWQDITQLFSRGGGQWTMFGLMMGNLIGGVSLVVLALVASFATGNPFAVSSAVTIIIIVLALISQLVLNKVFWKKIS